MGENHINENHEEEGLPELEEGELQARYARFIIKTYDSEFCLAVTFLKGPCHEIFLLQIFS